MVTTIYKVVSESNGISLNIEGDENICGVCKISTQKEILGRIRLKNTTLNKIKVYYAIDMYNLNEKLSIRTTIQLTLASRKLCVLLSVRFWNFKDGGS